MKYNQKGQTNTAILIFFVLLFCLILAIAFSPSKNTKRYHARGKHTVVHGEFLQPTADKRGRYAYEDDAGDWWIYYWNLNSNAYYVSGADTAQSSTPGKLPDGGFWAKTTEPVKPDEIVGLQDEEIAETQAGLPETEAEWTTENETDVENQSVEPENTAEPSNSSQPESAPDTSSPDSGDTGGADSGGDGGGGDGGGGGCMRFF